MEIVPYRKHKLEKTHTNVFIWWSKLFPREKSRGGGVWEIFSLPRWYGGSVQVLYSVYFLCDGLQLICIIKTFSSKFGQVYEALLYYSRHPKLKKIKKIKKNSEIIMHQKYIQYNVKTYAWIFLIFLIFKSITKKYLSTYFILTLL